MYTGGTGGPASRVRRSLELVDELAIQVALVLDAHGQAGADLALWYTGGINRLLTWSRLGNRTVGWFVPRSRVPWQLAVAAWHVAVVGRVGGHRFPLPRPCPPEDPSAIAAWLARRDGGRPLVPNTVASSGARIGIAARRLGLSLAGVTLLVESEPITTARRRHMEASGARVIVDYSAVEASGPAYSCAAPSEPDDTHVALDRFALVERPRQIGTGSVAVDALLVTSLSPATPKVLLNAELGDAALLEARAPDCCSLGALGLTTHLSRIESYETLSTEGTTFARSNVAQILDEAPPRRFGGTGLDYQIVEEERADGSTALGLRVDPSVGVVDEAALRHALVEELARPGMVARHHADLLRRVGSIEVIRRPPLATPAGKVLPLHLARRSRP